MKELRRHLGRFFRALGRAWCLVGILLLFLLVLEGGLSVALYVRAALLGSSAPSGAVDPRTRADGYDGAPWVEDLFREFEGSNRTEWHPFVYWKRKPYQGRYIHVDARGLRRTWNPGPAGGSGGEPPFRVFVFGGSAVWGTGVRDESTLPSCLSRALAGTDRPVEVTNFGETGYVNTQEMIAFFLELREGNAPDLAVFYDGANEVFSAFQNLEAGIPQNEEHRRVEFNALRETRKTRSFLSHCFRKTALYRFSEGVARRITGRPPPSPEGWRASLDTPRSEALARDVVRLYAENLRLIRALAEGAGVRTLFYWQPVVFGKKHRTPYEEGEAEKVSWLRDFYLEVCGIVADSEKLASIPGFHDLSGLFRDVEEPLFIDWCHLTEDGNARAARRIAVDVIELHW